MSLKWCVRGIECSVERGSVVFHFYRNIDEEEIKAKQSLSKEGRDGGWGKADAGAGNFEGYFLFM